MMDGKPLVVDGYCGLGGWTEGFLAEGWNCVGIDIERRDYGSGGYPGQLILQDMQTVTGHQFKGYADLFVFSPPCQFFSYTAMPWSKAKRLAEEVRSDPVRLEKELALFKACFRIAMEAEVPLIVENVRGAQPWVGQSRWHYGSFHLWGDVPALMPITSRLRLKGGDRNKNRTEGHVWTSSFADTIKNSGGSWFNIAHNTESGVGQNPDGRKLPGNNGPRRWEDREVARVGDATKGVPYAPMGHWTNPNENGSRQPNGSPEEGIKHHGSGPVWFNTGQSLLSSKSDSRKAASAQIARIPFALSRHIARCFKP